MNASLRKFHTLRRALLLATTLALLLGACTRSPAPEAVPDPAPTAPNTPNTLGLARITFSDLASDQPQSQMTFHPVSDVEGQALTPLPDGLEVAAGTPGSFTFANGLTADDCDNSNGTQFLFASYQVRNADTSGTAYTVARSNLTFLAIDNNGADYGDNAVAGLSAFDGTPFSADDTTAIGFANCLKPTHQTEADGSGEPQVQTNGADMQVFSEAELSGLGIVGTGTISNAFPYGYVVRNANDGGRTLAANPADGQFDGVITFAVRVPNTANTEDFPSSFSLWFYVFENSETFVTEDLTEQGDSSAEARANALERFGVPLRTLGNSPTDKFNIFNPPTSRFCQVRTAGAVATPTNFLVDATGDICSFTDGRIYVDETATGNNDGTTWTDAFVTLQDALAAARSNTIVKEIWVAAGTYYPDEGAATDRSGTPLATPDNDRTATFFVSGNVRIYGGFDGTEANRSDRNADLTTNVTILSGDIDADNGGRDTANPATDPSQIQGSNAYHVIFLDGRITAFAVIDRVSVTAGQANGTSPDDLGGAMVNISSTPTLTNVTFSGNTANNGGAMYNQGSTPELTNVTFSGNTANNGGAMFNLGSNPTFTDVTFTGNTANNGGALVNERSNPTFTDVTFSGNRATSGGAMVNSNSTPRLTDVTFSGNTATSGGAMFNDRSNPTLTNVTFSGNTANNGGAMSNLNNSNSTLTNVTFTGNTADNEGGAMYNEDSSPALINITFTSNTANRGGAMYNRSSNPTLAIATFTSNTATFGGAMYNGSDSNPTLTIATFTSNTADNEGGAIRNFFGGRLTLTNVTFTDNTADFGGAIDSSGSSSLTLTDVTFTGNAATFGGVLLGGGGAIRHLGSSLTLTNVTFSSNTAGTTGGAMYNGGDGNLTLTDVIFTGNTASSSGGAMYNIGSNLMLASVTFTGNTGSGGGAMYNFDSSLTLTDVTFTSNTATSFGGGAMVNSESNPTLTDVTFTDNTAAGLGDGGAMDNSESNPTLTNVTFTGNTADDGGAMRNAFNSNPTLTNVTFTGNMARDRGGAMYSTIDSTTTLINSTVTGNTAGAQGGGIWTRGNTTTDTTLTVLQNTIVLGNSAATENDLYADSTTTPWDGSHNLIGDQDNTGFFQNGVAGNIVDPSLTQADVFVDAPNGNLRLAAGSPAIDAGDNAALPQDTADLDGDNNTTETLPLDLDGNTRVVNTTVDMGAYEFQ